MLRASASTFSVSSISFAVFSYSDKLDNIIKGMLVRACDKVAALTSIGHVRAAATLAHPGTVLAFIRILGHHALPAGLRALATVAGHGRLVTVIFDLGGEDGSFSRKVAPGLCDRVSYAAEWMEGGNIPKQDSKALALSRGKEALCLSGRKTLGGGIVLRTNYKRRPGRAHGEQCQPIIQRTQPWGRRSGSPGRLATRGRKAAGQPATW